MNAWIRNERRLLLPAAVAGVGIILLGGGMIRLTGSSMAPTVELVVVFAVCLLLGVQVFGGEFTHGTATLLLTHPLSRRSLWWTKVRQLLPVVGMVVAADTVIAAAAGLIWDPAGWLLDHAAAVLAGAGGGLFFSLLTRQTGAAIWLGALGSLGVGAFLQLGISLLPPDWQWRRRLEGVLMGFWSVWGIAYGVTCYWLARRRFLRFEDLPAWSGELHWRGRDLKVTATHPEAPPPGGTRRAIRRALRRKEWRLQQLNWVVAGCLASLTVAVALSLRARDGWIRLEWVMPVLLLVWGLLPLMVGAAAVSEERRLGMLEIQQALPVTVGRQWWLKVRQAFLVSLLLGVVVPVVLGLALIWVTSRSGDGPTRDRMLYELAVPLALGILWVLATTAGLYASSLARNLLQALTFVTGLIGGLAGMAMIGNRLWGWWGPPEAPPYWLAALIAPLLLIPTLLWLGGRNHRANLSGSQRLRLNATVLPGMVLAVMALTAAVYCRVWEIWPPRPVGTALNAKPGIRPKLVTSGESVPEVSSAYGPEPATVAALLPDGRIRVHAAGWLRPWLTAPGDADLPPPAETRLLPGEGPWRDVAMCDGTVFAIRTDGTLWGWGWRWAMVRWTPFEMPLAAGADPQGPGEEFRSWMTNRIAPPPSDYVENYTQKWLSQWHWWGPHLHNPAAMPSDPVMVGRWSEEQPWRIGGATNWVTLAGAEHDVLGLRNDGTAWRWGYGPRATWIWDDLLPPSPEPVQILPGTDWVGMTISPHTSRVLWAAGDMMQRWPTNRWQPSRWRLSVPLHSGGNTNLIVWNNGWLGGVLVQGRLWGQTESPGEDAVVPIQELWPGKTWNDAAIAWTTLWAIRQDGMLWRYRWEVEAGRRVVDPHPLGWERLDRRTDWLAVAQLDRAGDAAALSADGRVWRFQDPRERDRRDEGLPRLIRVSKRPRLLVDFAGAVEVANP
ncbi:MAG: ABC transporter permease [Verrucomicrobiae bacterium]|nr:ABC transporter permease [Verrucomicrobiae bacterium]